MATLYIVHCLINQFSLVNFQNNNFTVSLSLTGVGDLRECECIVRFLDALCKKKNWIYNGLFKECKIIVTDNNKLFCE